VFDGPDGNRWLDARDEDGTRRLDNPNDFVRVEIGTALQRDIPVIPILLDGVKIPRANQLPNDLEELAVRNALDVRHTSFHSDMDKLIRELKRQLADSEKQGAQPSILGAVLTPDQFEQLQRILTDAFDKRGIAELVSTKLGDRLDKLVDPDQPTPGIVFDLLTWIDKRDMHTLEVLLKGAIEMKPENGALRAFCEHNVPGALSRTG
jgi:hypothetical protein